jgi:peptidoglycan-associated lipoprotein
VLVTVGIFFAGSARRARWDAPLVDVSAQHRYVPEPNEGSDGPGEELDSAYFPYDSSQLTPVAKEILRENARWLKAHPEAAIQIEGYCDYRGTHQYNLPLGNKRAERAKAYLVGLGVPAERISTVSHGRVEDGDARSWARNRRAAFLIFYPNGGAQAAR